MCFWKLFGVVGLLTLTQVVSALPKTSSISHHAARGNDMDVLEGLVQYLSPRATVTHNISLAARWSEFAAPQPVMTVNVADETDVESTVKYCLKHDIPFLTQTGAHGWISSFGMHKKGIIINMRGLNQITFNDDHTEVHIQGGSLVKEVIDQAYAHDAQVLTGNCNCVGVLGAALGGGYGNLMGLHGPSVDNFISMNVVVANGTAVKITEKDDDLWWAFRGAGPNFGIVTSAVMKSHPVPKAQSVAWQGMLFFTEDKLEQLVQGIQDLHLAGDMVLFFYFITSGAPDFIPTIVAAPFYYGSEAAGRQAFKSILDIGPYKDTTSMLAYNHWNDGGDGFCVKGGRKPAFGVGLSKMVPETWREIWNAYTEFIKHPTAGYSSVVTECYSLGAAESVPKASSAFGNRGIAFNSVTIPWYYNESLDATAQAYGSRMRDILRASDDHPTNRTYINFAFGDESNEVVYGSALDRLKGIKAQYDPQNVFKHWFPIKV